MTSSWKDLNSRDYETFRVSMAFLNSRLGEQRTIEWALKLNRKQRVERIAIGDILNSPGAPKLAEPWATAWRLIEESWSNADNDRDGTSVHGLHERLQAGDRSGSLVAAIVDLVAPRLKVKAIDEWRWSVMKKPRTPKSIGHVLATSVTSGTLVDLDVLQLTNLDDTVFLRSLANALESAVNRGIDIAKRLGWDETQSLLTLGMLDRVYYTRSTGQGDADRDPDSYHHGIAPSVKLLHAAVRRIANLDTETARMFVYRWAAIPSPVFVRLWAALARCNQLVPAETVSLFLRSIDEWQFWNLHVYPEIAELRAVRFGEFDPQSQKAIIARLQKAPPRGHWSRKADATQVADARLFRAVQELRRIEVAGGSLPERAKIWLDARIARFDTLAQMSIDEGFPGNNSIFQRGAKLDVKYDALAGVERLKALEGALGTSPHGWDDDPAERANNWINRPGSASQVLADFEGTNSGGNDFPRIWNRLGWAHRPQRQEGETALDDRLRIEGEKVLALLIRLSDATLRSAVEGICSWLDTWDKIIGRSILILPVWLRLWPIAAMATNQRRDDTESEDLLILEGTNNDDRETPDLDTLNTPSGKLVGVFLSACPNLEDGVEAFAADSIERRMRDTVVIAAGRTGLIAKHRMIEALPYFLRADHAWTQEHLVAPLLNDDGDALELWRAVARRTHFTKVLRAIGGPMAERANDRRLSRETRRQLAFSLVVESLHAFRENRSPAVPNLRVQQMLRKLEDEVRASAANTIQLFVSDLSTQTSSDAFSHSSDELFRSAATPFLRDVWPQERSLATPGVSRALADLPATSGEAFADAVDAIERFLVPFDCWSMYAYGLYADEDQEKKLDIINDEAKARALLKLLDLTIGRSEGAVIPRDLGDALDRISHVSTGLARTETFRRLATEARR